MSTSEATLNNQVKAPRGLAAAWKWWVTPRSTDREVAFRERTVRAMVVFLSGLMLTIITITFLAASVPNQRALVWAALLLVIAGSGIAVSRGKATLAGIILVSILALALVIVVIRNGYWSGTVPYVIMIAIPMAAVLLRRRLALASIVVINLIYVGMGLWQAAKGISPSTMPPDPLALPVLGSMVITAGVVVVTALGAYLLNEFDTRLKDVNQLVATLESRVAERTRDLKIAADVSRQATTVLDPDKLLPDLVERTRQGFDLYAVSIFLFDEQSERITLKASTGEAGRKMLLAGHSFHITQRPSIVAQASAEGQPVVIEDVTQSATHLVNPDLPATRSEAALPMLVGQRLIGVLDLQSKEAGRFRTEDLEILETLAEQIAIAVHNAQLFEEVEASRMAAEEANEVKSRFLANMSHELRTPLNAILNFTAFVADGVMGPVNEEQADALQQSIASGKHLLSLINDILDITKIEAGMMEMFMQEVDLNAALAATVSVAKGLVKDKPIKLITDIDEDLPITYGDKRRLRQVFLNLVSNAVKFTNEGAVEITAHRENGGVQIRVRDTGIGIAPEDQHLVFETFRQIKKHDLIETPGTGLGMPISKFFVELHSGRMTFESQPGKGTCFTVALPILSQAEADALAQITPEETAE